MAKIPKHIKNAILSKKTSLGNSPALPPDEFLLKIVASYYSEISKGMEDMSLEEITEELNKTFTDCYNEEQKDKHALEKLCADIVSDFFEIPEDTIKFEVNLTDSVDTSSYRLLPEEEEDFTFEDISDMKNMEEEIYKRRMLNALLEGASETIAYNISNYVQEIFKINPSLPSLYAKIIRYCQYLMYAMTDASLKSSNMDSGCVKIQMKAAPEMLQITAEGMIFPILLQNAIKGALEVAILQGLPDDKDRAYYVMKKADFKLAEIWDSRLGVPLWGKLAHNENIEENGLNFFFMELSTLPIEFFNETLQEAFVGTKKGKDTLNMLLQTIERKKSREDFYDYIDKQNQLYPVEDGFFSEEELLNKKPIDY